MCGCRCVAVVKHIEFIYAPFFLCVILVDSRLLSSLMSTKWEVWIRVQYPVSNLTHLTNVRERQRGLTYINSRLFKPSTSRRRHV